MSATIRYILTRELSEGAKDEGNKGKNQAGELDRYLLSSILLPFFEWKTVDDKSSRSYTYLYEFDERTRMEIR